MRDPPGHKGEPPHPDSPNPVPPRPAEPVRQTTTSPAWLARFSDLAVGVQALGFRVPDVVVEDVAIGADSYDARTDHPIGVGRHTVGLLRRRPVEDVQPVVLIGKEGNRIDDRLSGLVTEVGEYRSEYVEPGRTFWSELVVPILRTMNRANLVKDSCLHRRTIERLLSGEARPHERTERKLADLAVDHARQVLSDRGDVVPRDPMGVLQRFMAEETVQATRCRGCRRILSGRQRSWCSNECRMRSRRARGFMR